MSNRSIAKVVAHEEAGNVEGEVAWVSDTTMQDCPRFRRCSAPLCLMDASLSKRDGWWTDEPICGDPDFRQHPLIRRQRRLARLARRRKLSTPEFHSCVKLMGSVAVPQKRSQTKRDLKVVI